MLNSSSLIRTARFGAGAVIVRARGAEAISFDQIASQTPAVFAEEAHESRSSRYTYIPTREVLQGLQREGFEPFEVRQGGSRDEAKRGFTKHMIRMRHRSNGALTVGTRADSIIPEIILLNSHDGTSSYQLTAGCFRMVCTNGLIAGEAFDHVRVPHKGDIVSDVIDAAFRVVGEFPAMIDGAERMAGVQLDEREQMAFARAARQLRWEPDRETQRDTAPVEAAALLPARRAADVDSSVWTTFNRVQENLIRGGQRYILRDENGRRLQQRRTSEVRGIDQDRALNRALWTLASEMEAIKSGRPSALAA